MARRRNGRAVLVAELRSLKGSIATFIDFWTVSGKVYVEPQDRDVQSQWWRKRRPEEYPEAKFQNWALMARNAEAMASRFSEIERFCWAQCEELRRASETE